MTIRFSQFSMLSALFSVVSPECHGDGAEREGLVHDARDRTVHDVIHEPAHAHGHCERPELFRVGLPVGNCRENGDITRLLEQQGF